MKKLPICLLSLCLCIAAGCSVQVLLPPDSAPPAASTTSSAAETTLATDEGTTAATTAATSESTASFVTTTYPPTHKDLPTIIRTTTTKAPTTKAPTTKAPTTKAPTTKATTTQATLSSAQRAQEVFRLVNAERAKEGVAPLAYYTAGQAAADIRAVELHTLFEHTRPDGTLCFSALNALGIAYSGAAENIAAGQRTPAEVVDEWMHSEGHRKNILNPKYTHIIISENDLCWVQLFMTDPRKA